MKCLALPLAFGLSVTSAAVSAEQAQLDVRGVQLTIPVPLAYKDVSAENEMPAFARSFETAAVEPWEEIGEINEGMFITGFAYASPDEAVQQRRFDAMYDAVGAYLLAKSEGREITPTGPDLAVGAFEEITDGVGRGGVVNLAKTEDGPRSKGYVFDTGFVMPGVVTYPMVFELSMVRANGVLVVTRTWRVADKPSVRTQVTRVARKLRADVLRANPS